MSLMRLTRHLWGSGRCEDKDSCWRAGGQHGASSR